MLTQYGLARDDPSHVRLLGGVHRDGCADWRDPISLFQQTDSYPVVPGFEAIPVDVEPLPLQSVIFHDDEIDTTVEIEVATYGRSAVERTGHTH